jgi:hypothetical protein
MKSLFAILLLCVLGAGLASAGTFPVGVKVFSGYDMPIIQDDVGKGTMFGASVRAHAWGPFHGELYFRSTSQSSVDVSTDIPTDPTITFAGGTLSGFGLNLLIAAKGPASVWPYFLLGVSSNSRKPGESFQEDKTLTGWSFGGGTGINLYNRALYLDINTSLLLMPMDNNKASRKNWQTLVGIQYFIPIHTK